MSRIGKLPITIPNGVTITVDSSAVNVKGPKGELSEVILPGVEVKQEDDKIVVKRKSEEKIDKSNHGLMRTLISNMVVGVTDGFSKELELEGVGYRVALAGKNLKFNIGLSHDVVFEIPQGLEAKVDSNKITISGSNKQQVGQIAAEIRALKKPEPYKGKGIHYVGEYIIRKSGKSGKEAA